MPEANVIITTPLPPLPGLETAPTATEASPSAPAGTLSGTPSGISPPLLPGNPPGVSPGSPPTAAGQGTAGGPAETAAGSAPPVAGPNGNGSTGTVQPAPAPTGTASTGTAPTGTARTGGSPAGGTSSSPPGAPNPAPADQGSPLPATWLPRATAMLQVLDKETGGARALTVAVGQSVQIGPLTITVRACMVRPPTMPGDATAFLDIADHTKDDPGFQAWSLKNEPFLSMYQNPLYNVRVLGCGT